MAQTIKTVDLVTTYYKVINGDPQFEEKRFLDPDAAWSIADNHAGEVVKVVKRTVETIEFEKVSRS